MPVIPLPCSPGGTGPATGEGCCSPSIASQPLCLADGTPIVLVLRSGCAACSATPGAPEVAGWMDPETGVFTEGPAPAGAGPCTPTGPNDCEPVPMCPQLLGLTGPETWTAPADAESLQVTVTCGPVTITDCTGNATVVNECGTAFSWAAPGTACSPGVLCGPVTVDIPADATAYVQWTSPCGTSDDS